MRKKHTRAGGSLDFMHPYRAKSCHRPWSFVHGWGAVDRLRFHPMLRASILLATLTLGCAFGCGGREPPEGPPPDRLEPTMPHETPRHEPDPVPAADSPYGRIYQLRDDQELRVELQRALAAARAKEGKLLIVFGAEWCPDCRQVAKLLEESPAADVVRERYEVVHVNIGRRDRHLDLLERYRVERISTLVVLDGSARRVAQTTLEPISNRTGLTSAALASWLREPRDPWRRPERDPLGSSAGPGAPPDDSPLFPPELLGE